MAKRIDDQLRAFDPSTHSWTACTVLLRASGASVRLGDWTSLEELASTRGRSEELKAIRARAAQPAVRAAGHELVRLDARDGIANALRVAMVAIVRREITSVLREQQGRDAVHKAFVLSWVTARLFDGPPAERVQALLALPAGRALVDLYGVVEVALPFLEAGPSGRRLADLGAAYGVDALKELCTRLGPEVNEETRAVLPALLPELDASVRRAAARAHGVLEAASALLPVLRPAEDVVADAVATGVDLLPLYHLLGPRLIAEACAADPYAAPKPAAAWLPATDPTEVHPAEAPTPNPQLAEVPRPPLLACFPLPSPSSVGVTLAPAEADLDDDDEPDEPVAEEPTERVEHPEPLADAPTDRVQHPEPVAEEPTERFEHPAPAAQDEDDLTTSRFSPAFERDTPNFATWADPTDEQPLPVVAVEASRSGSEPEPTESPAIEAPADPPARPPTEAQVMTASVGRSPTRPQPAPERPSLARRWGRALIRITAFSLVAGVLVATCMGIGTAGLAATGLVAWIGLDYPMVEWAPAPKPPSRRKPPRPRPRR